MLWFIIAGPMCVCGRFITYRSARASKDHHCIFGLQTSSHSPEPRCVVGETRKRGTNNQRRYAQNGQKAGKLALPLAIAAVFGRRLDFC